MNRPTPDSKLAFADDSVGSLRDVIAGFVSRFDGQKTGVEQTFDMDAQPS